MWTALAALASVLEGVVEGRAEPIMYLSSLDPGIGKTQTIVHFVRALMNSPVHRDVGVLICLSRLKEIKSDDEEEALGLVDEMALSPSDFAVLTSNAELNKLGLGSERANEARVLFTTQQMIETRTQGRPGELRRREPRSFEALDEFHFRGCARQLRVWDESILTGRVLTLSQSDMKLLSWALDSTPLGDAIDALRNELAQLEDRKLYELPDFAARFGLDLNDALGLVASKQPQEALKQAITALWLLSGSLRCAEMVAMAMRHSTTRRPCPRDWNRLWS